jgi:hypothetical protein
MNIGPRSSIFHLEDVDCLLFKSLIQNVFPYRWQHSFDTHLRYLHIENPYVKELEAVGSRESTYDYEFRMNEKKCSYHE